MSEYVIATAPLFMPGSRARAHNKGDRVLAEHAKKYGWEPYTVGESTKAAAEVTADVTPEPAPAPRK
jgi:hypothetical protein